MNTSRRLLLLTVLALAIVAGPAAGADDPIDPALLEPHVVVATLDTGVNPLHPAWQRDQPHHPSTFIPGYPADAGAVEVTVVEDDWQASVEASAAVTGKFGADLTWIPGTNLIGLRAHETDERPVFDPQGGSHSHGAQASSQIAGLDHGIAEDAWIVIVDRTNDGAGGGTSGIYRSNADLLMWAADQPWIDIIHTNIQDITPLNNSSVPFLANYPEAVAYAVSKGKLVISAGGNWYAEPTETSPHAGPRGVLVAGASDNCGSADFSNPNPHVVMDGYGTVSAAPSGFGTAEFGGTSSASPRTTGYAAQLLLDLRRAFDYDGGMVDGDLIVLDEDERPTSGPLADGALTAAELHEVIRRTANPKEHDSKYDGAGFANCIPDEPVTPISNYPKMGYGEVSEHTIAGALAVLLGEEAVPERPVADIFYEASETQRELYWETLGLGD